MIKRFALSAAIAIALSTSAFSATPTTWYVAQNIKTSNCIVTPTKPNGTSYTMVGTDTYPTSAAALKDMRAEATCKPVTTTAATKTAKPKTTAPKATSPSTTY